MRRDCVREVDERKDAEFSGTAAQVSSLGLAAFAGLVRQS